MAKFTVKVTKTHFDKALAIIQKNPATVSATRVCLLAQAIKDVFPRKKVDVNYYTAWVGENYFSLNAKGRRLIKRFDDNGAWHAEKDRTKKEITALARLRAGLPTTFTMTSEA